MTTLRIQRLPNAVSLPSYAKPGDAGMDLASPIDTVLQAGYTLTIMLGLKVAVPDGYVMQIVPRSGLASKYSVTVLNSPGTVDSGFRGELGVILTNTGEDDFPIKRGDRIAQAMITPVIRAVIEEVPELDETERGSGGFGSTGVSATCQESPKIAIESRSVPMPSLDGKPYKTPW